MSSVDSSVAKDNQLRVLVFRIGEETYASPLLSVREVLEYQKPKYMPNMLKHFSGVINVRGAIVGVVDMRIKFGHPGDIQNRLAMLLCDTEKGPLAAIVDGVQAVIQLTDNDIDRDPPIRTRTSQKYLLGVAKSQEKLITLIDLHQILNDDELKTA